jgi:23S rRNA pseudouridine2605 synthase
MNNKEGNNSGGRANSSDHIQISQNLPCRSAQGPKKVKVTTKVAEVTTDKVEKKANQAPKRPKVKDEIRLNKYISNSGVCSRRDADIYITSGTVKVNGIAVTEMGYMVKPGDVVNFDGAH